MIEKLEAHRIDLQAALDAQKGAEERNRLGQFSTPSPLAFDILAYAQEHLPKGKIRFLDPALGSGAFYAALLRTFGAKRLKAAQAFEIDPHYGKPAEELWGGQGLQLVHGDFTLAKPQVADLIICNPPYVRHHHLDASTKSRLLARTEEVSGVRLSGLAGLYCHFLLQAHAWMAPGALAGWLIPSEFMDVNYGQAIKEFLLNRVSLLHIHRFDPNDVQFADALVSSAVVWLRNTPPKADHAVRFTYGGTLHNPTTSMLVSNSDLAKERKWTRFPLKDVRQAAAGQQTVGDLFMIKRGIATGDNTFFVLDEETVKRHKLPKAALRPILPSPRHVADDAILDDGNGTPANARRLFLLDPRMDEAEIQKRHPALAAYLDEGRARGLPERYLCRSRKRWYDQEQRPAAPIVCTYLGRGDAKTGRPFRFIRNHTQATVANSYLAMYPTPALQAKLDKNPRLIDELWEQLNRIPAEDLLGEGRVYGGGLHKLEPKELAKVPLNV